MSKVNSLSVTPMEGGFIVNVSVFQPGMGQIDDTYIVNTYAKLLKAIKNEFRDYKPVRKTKEKVNADQA